ncbi:Z-ring formation inhibitor MciZ [Cohnella faecalis]|uniref:Z-ring formation inhibitor MciZ n=1 Tax=Cohnella faecalis TaxID=2315694 RepID=A0A398CZB2_9BACL|nr:Z-ring formation inhibitor MciZ [Cohnella faecalis]RIE04561.1 Z-ring formation inhibitor MciZ [Cohnella faecalis]
MLKKYAASHKLQWVGKAWEIRHAIRQEMNRKGGNARLADLLAPKDDRAVKI